MEYLYNHISTKTTTTVASSTSGVLHSVVVNKSDNTVTIFDVNGTLAILKSGIAEGTYQFDIIWTNYLKITTAGTPDLTVSYGVSQR